MCFLYVCRQEHVSKCLFVTCIVCVCVCVCVICFVWFLHECVCVCVFVCVQFNMCHSLYVPAVCQRMFFLCLCISDWAQHVLQVCADFTHGLHHLSNLLTCPSGNSETPVAS